MGRPIFGKPETGGVVLREEPPKREVRVRGYVTARIEVDAWVEVTDDMSDTDIRQAALEDVVIDGFIERQSLYIEDSELESRRRELREQRQRDQQKLAAWLQGEPIRA